MQKVRLVASVVLASLFIGAASVESGSATTTSGVGGGIPMCYECALRAGFTPWGTLTYTTYCDEGYELGGRVECEVTGPSEDRFCETWGTECGIDQSELSAAATVLSTSATRQTTWATRSENGEVEINKCDRTVVSRFYTEAAVTRIREATARLTL